MQAGLALALPCRLLASSAPLQLASSLYGTDSQQLPGLRLQGGSMGLYAPKLGIHICLSRWQNSLGMWCLSTVQRSHPSALMCLPLPCKRALVELCYQDSYSWLAPCEEEEKITASFRA